MTVISQAPNPLSLRSLSSPATKLPTYLMKPYKMPCDMYHENVSFGNPETCLRRSAPYQHDLWYLEPYYLHGVNVILDIQTGHVFTAKHFKIVNKIVKESATEALVKVSKSDSWPKEYRYLHALRFFAPLNVESNVVVFEQPTVIVDILTKDVPYIRRRLTLEAHFDQLGIRVAPPQDKITLVPRFCEAEGEPLWAGLHLMNQEFSSPLYGGMVEKRATAPYIHQLEGECTTAMSWIYHPFNDLQ